MGPPIFSAVVHHASEPSRLFEQQRRLAPKPFEFLSGSWGDVAITVMELFAARTIRPLSLCPFWCSLGSGTLCSERVLAVAPAVSAGPLSDKRPTKTSPPSRGSPL